MSPKRSRFQVSVDVLTAIYNGDQVKEKIMDTCNLSLGSIDDTLTFLAEKGYVDELYESPNGASYRISKKGGTVLRYCNNTQDAINVTAYLKIK